MTPKTFFIAMKMGNLGLPKEGRFKILPLHLSTRKNACFQFVTLFVTLNSQSPPAKGLHCVINQHMITLQ
jgi:hypothetical protein